MPDLDLQLNNVSIPKCLTPSILGIKFDPSLSFKPNFESVIEKCNSKLNFFRILSNHNKNLDKNKLSTVYKTYILSWIQYHILHYLYLNKVMKEKLQTIQNDALRSIYHLSRFTSTNQLHRVAKIAKINSVSEYLEVLTQEYFDRIKTSNSFVEIYNILCEDSKHRSSDKYFSPL